MITTTRRSISACLHRTNADRYEDRSLAGLSESDAPPPPNVITPVSRECDLQLNEVLGCPPRATVCSGATKSRYCSFQPTRNLTLLANRKPHICQATKYENLRPYI